ncbi:MAG: hypothetical protein ACXVAU_07345, partial [Mucilaginibacter sp.]
MYKLAKYIFIVFLLMGIGSKTLGQVPRPIFRRPPNFQQRVIRQPNGVRKIEAVRENYMSKRLNLSAEQSVK